MKSPDNYITPARTFTGNGPFCCPIYARNEENSLGNQLEQGYSTYYKDTYPVDQVVDYHSASRFAFYQHPGTQVGFHHAPSHSLPELSATRVKPEGLEPREVSGYQSVGGPLVSSAHRLIPRSPTRALVDAQKRTTILTPTKALQISPGGYPHILAPSNTPPHTLTPSNLPPQSNPNTPNITSPDAQVQKPQNTCKVSNTSPSTSSYDIKAPTSAAGPATPPARRFKKLSLTAVTLMEAWYRAHFDHPYPDSDVIETLVRAGDVTASQVKKWMANKRVRSFNTLSFNGSMHPKRRRRMERQQRVAKATLVQYFDHQGEMDAQVAPPASLNRG